MVEKIHYNMESTKMNLLKEKIKNKEYLNEFLNTTADFSGNRGLSQFSAYCLYSFIRTYKPKKIIEMSPNYGWSTKIMLSAIRDENYEIDFFHSYDLKLLLAPDLIKFVKQFKQFKFFEGDAKANLKLNEEIDFFFIDSDHSLEFANWYLPFLDKTKSFFVDDIDPSEEYHKKFRPDNSNVHCGGEPLVIYNWLREKGYRLKQDKLNYIEKKLTYSENESGEFACYWNHDELKENEKLFWNHLEQLNYSYFTPENNRNMFYINFDENK